MSIGGKLLRTARDDEAVLEALNRSQAVIQFSPEAEILTANENFLRTMGYRLDEIAGKRHQIFMPPGAEREEGYRAFWDRLRRGEFQSGEYKRVGKGGREVWIQASYNPILDAKGRVYKIVKYASDVTAQKLKNADYEGQISAIGKALAVIQFDLDANVIDANANFLAAMGYSLEEIKGRPHRMFVERDFAASADYAQSWARLRAGEFMTGEFKRLGKGGKEVWIQASYNPIFDLNGKPFKVVKYATDVTAQVLARREAQRASQTINDSLQTILTSLDAADARISESASASTETSAMVQTVAAAAEELTGSVREISINMDRSKSSIDQAVDLARAADQSTQGLAQSAQAMTSIVDLIQGIAAQISLLSLNATIESARAGEAGRGFAVVASEVKQLSTQVSNATDTIAQEIANLQSVSGEVVKSLAAIRAAMDQTIGGFTSVVGAVSQQSAVTGEISANMHAAASAVGEIDRGISSIAAMVNDVNVSTGQVRASMAALLR